MTTPQEVVQKYAKQTAELLDKGEEYKPGELERLKAIDDLLRETLEDKGISQYLVARDDAAVALINKKSRTRLALTSEGIRLYTVGLADEPLFPAEFGLSDVRPDDSKINTNDLEKYPHFVKDTTAIVCTSSHCQRNGISSGAMLAGFYTHPVDGVMIFEGETADTISKTLAGNLESLAKRYKSG